MLQFLGYENLVRVKKKKSGVVERCVCNVECVSKFSFFFDISSD